MRTLSVTPLTHSQLGIYLEYAENPGSLMYNTPFFFRFTFTPDTDRLKRAIIEAVNSHPSSGIIVRTENGVPCMAAGNFDFEISEKTVASLQDEADHFVRPFDLENGPLFRFEILHTPEGDGLFFDGHHIIFDGAGIRLLAQQIAKAYDGVPCDRETYSIFDAKADEAALEESGARTASEKYFRDRLEGLDFDLKPASDVFTESGDTIPFGAVNASSEGFFDSARVGEFVSKAGISENALFIGAFAYALSKFSGTDASFFCTGHHGRNAQNANTIGMFVKTLPMYFSIDENERVTDFLKRVYNDYYETKKNSFLPFASLVADYGISTDISFVFHSSIFENIHMKEGELCLEYISVNRLSSDLEFMFMKSSASYDVHVRYKYSFYSEALIRGLTRLFLNTVRQMLCCDSLGDIELADAEARNTLSLLNRTEADYPKHLTVIDQFRAQVQKTPDNICTVYKDKQYTYKEIDEWTDIIARHLVRLGCGAETVTGVLIPRNEFMVIASLGVLKAGGAYLPLDPTYPPERLNLMLKDSGAALLITDMSLESVITEGFTGVRLTTDELRQLPDIDEALPAPKPGDMFVMLYTSGSTGLPKGVMFEHSNTLVTTEWAKKYFELNENSRMTIYSSYGFDAHVLDLYSVITSGAQLHIIPDEIRLDLPALRDYYNTCKITHSIMTMQVGRQVALMGGFRTLRHLGVAGEKLTPLDPPAGMNFYNLYGPTEASVITSAFPVTRKYKDVPIGRAVDNLKTYIVDSRGRLLPAGAVGELWVSGPHVTRGYLNRPEKQAEAFSMNTFENLPGYERVYHTGDIVRLCEDGNLQYVGRRDAQVKIRGFRVELTEVEEIIRRFDGIVNATVAAFASPAGGKYLAAYIVSDEPVDTKSLCEFIRSEKPPYMVPGVIMQIDKIPFNQNGKVNRKALPLPVYTAQNITPPENDRQKQIFDLISEILEHCNFGIDTDLFEAGLSSIGIIRLNMALGEALGISVKLGDVKNNPTVRKLEAFSHSAVKSGLRKKQTDYPLSGTQRGILTECLSKENSTAYNIPLLLKLGHGIDLLRLKSSTEKAINAHPFLKAVLEADKNGDIRVKRNDDAPANVHLIDGDPDFKDLVRPYRLLGGELYRAEIYRGSSDNYLFIDSHHILNDGTGVNILLTDIELAYRGEAPAPETYTGYDASEEEEAALQTEAYTAAKAHFDSLFAGCEGDCLPTKTPARDEHGAAHCLRTLDTDFEAVRKYCSDNEVTPNAFFNAVFGLVLSRFDYKDDVVYTTVYNGRNDSRLARSIAMLVKTLPVAFRSDEKSTVRDTVRKLGSQLMDSMANDIFPFSEISRTYSIKADRLFVYQGDEFTFDSLCGEKAELIPLESADAKAPISLSVYVREGRIVADAEYDRSVFKEEYISSFTDAFSAATGEFLRKEKLSEISLITDNSEELYRILNDNDTPVRNVPCFVQIDDFAKVHPDKPAVITTEKTISFKELSEMSDRVAAALRKRKLKRGTIIGLILERSVWIYVCELGIMKAGCAFLPMLPSYPGDRIDYCLINAESPLVITSSTVYGEMTDLFSSEKPYGTVTVEALLEGEDKEPDNEDASGELQISLDDPAYCIYTSGSTGKPKGVLIRHGNLTNFVQTLCKRIRSLSNSEEEGSSISMSSVSFDMSICEMLPPLCAGKTTCMATEDEIHNPQALTEFLTRADVKTMICTPTFMTNMLGIPKFTECIGRLTSILIGAEAFPPALYDTLRAAAPDVQILNAYGPTECAVCCSVKELSSGNNVTIGRPNGNIKFYVTDRFGNILPAYASGELIICGAGVGAGYIRLPDKTSEQFCQFRGLPAYRSGDLVYLTGDAEIAFTGRIDNQIKLRGFRIELDEIEKVACSFEGVKQCRILLRNNGSEDYLAGFFTADRSINIAEFTAYLKSELTYYMIPAVLVQLDKMPLTPNGKIDKNGFPKTGQIEKKTGRRAAKKSLEQMICDIFADVLKLSEVYADDNFFELGGTSLSASKVTMQLMSENIDAKYGDIFDNPTPEGLATFLEKKAPAGNAGPGLSSPAGDMHKTRKSLEFNTVAYAGEVERKPLGDVLLTGAVGFLGIHVLKELLELESGHIYCLVRKGHFESAEKRLRTMLVYYFSNDFEDEFRTRITIIEADITDRNIGEVFKDIRFDTVINCAACVKHFTEDDILERINVHGVENLISLCQKREAKLIQISTVSVPGIHTAETYAAQVRMHENELFVVDDMRNKYGISKYKAELLMFDAIEKGMRGKVIRVGNLMGRYTDGEFQINMSSNMFLKGIRGFATMGKYPISHMTDPMNFSPVDCTARAVVLLAGVNDMFTAFNCNNRYSFDEMKLIDACNRNGITILPEKDEIYYREFREKLGRNDINDNLNGLAAYDIQDAHAVETDNLFTTNILYRIGFSWPITDESYLDRAIMSVKTLDYFDVEEPESRS